MIHQCYSSAVVSAAIVRVFGEEVAELPLVATRSDCQGKVGHLIDSDRIILFLSSFCHLHQKLIFNFHLQGYFQALFACIEDLLLSLNIKVLVLPAADEAESLWKNRFGFEKLDQEKVS